MFEVVYFTKSGQRWEFAGRYDFRPDADAHARSLRDAGYDARVIYEPDNDDDE